MLGDFALVALLADFLSLDAEAVKEGGLEANVSLAQRRRDGLGTH